ncbi:hypothetical protein SAMN02745134_02688 [Clostridium acidisoli DSM 12555]|uniref:Uncharacterized protein n=1 Tax=Clostridium acidisoli DSM 12555 TaxID=1121291 RepID=A0A1W1XPW4_9CLOT|nr:hypothetical protein [Clostridium acidisoli]SMC26040.1 hypothetical protein SAMN02745134_02688 [Clostridium acidisoli DSM 12555]
MGLTAVLILKVLVFAFIAIVIYNLLKKFVFSKFKPNLTVKIIATVISVILVVLSGYFSSRYSEQSWQYYIGTGIVILVILTTLDFWVGDKNKKNIKSSSSKNDSFKPKPKAKPNRVKNKKN